MMRRGPLSTYTVESLLNDASRERVNGVLVLSGGVAGRIYLVEGDIYYADRPSDPPLEQRLVANGVFTQEQVDNHGVPGPEGLYLARALDTDLTIDEDVLDAFLLTITAATVSDFLDHADGEFELDPYGTHPAGVLSSWHPEVVLERVGELREEAARQEAERLEAERIAAEKAEAERLEAERIAAEKAEAERLEAERLEAERLEAERIAAEKAEAERLEVERLEAERVDAERRAAEAFTLSQATLPSEAVAIIERLASEGVPVADRKVGALHSIGPASKLIVSGEPPEGMDRIDLAGVEWRVLIRASRGDTVGAIAAGLDLSLETVQAVVEGLWCRGVVAAVHPGVAPPA